ncbi:MAG: TonB-dependent receptor plug domain-containing protein [Gemmatimonadaceae bacterium]
MTARWLLALPLAVAIACSHPRLGPGEVYNSQVITEDEIIASRGTNAYDVIHKLRANFLTNRGETSFNRGQSNPYPTVYLDDQEFGPIAALRTIPAAQISMIRLYRVAEANAKYGTHNLSGVIAITTRQ